MSFGIIPPREIALETASPCLPSCKRNAELPPHTNSAHQTVSYVIQDFFLDEITANVVASAPDLRVPALVSSFGKVLHQYFAQEGAPSLLEDFIHGPEVRQALRNQFSSGPEGFVVATATALRRVQMKIQDYFGPQFCLHDVLQEEELDDDEDDETELIISRVASSFYDEHESNSEAMKEAALEQFDQFKVDIVDQVRAKISSRNYKGPEWRKSAVWRKQVRGSISELYDVAVEVFEEMVEESPFLLNLAMFLEDASSCINLVAATIKIGDDQGAIGLADTSGTVARLVRFCETPNAVSKLVEEIGERVVRREREEAAMRQKAVEVALAAKLKEAHPPPNGTATASTSAASSSSAPNNVNGSTPAKKKDDSFDVLMERSSALRRKGEIRDEREQAEKQIVDLQALLVKLAEEEKALEVTLALPNAAPAPPAPSTSKKAGPSSTNAASKPTDDSDSDDDMPPLEPISDDDTPAPSTSRPAPAAAKPSPTPSKPKAKAAPSSSKPAPKPTPAPVIDSDDDMPPLEPISDDEAPPAPSTSRPAPKTAKPSPGTPKPKGTPSKPKTTVNCTPKPAPKPKVDDSDDMPPLEPISDDETPAPAAASRAPPPPFTAASTKKAPTPASKAKAAPFKSVDDDDPPEVGLDDDSDSDMPPLEPIDSDGDDGDVTDASMPPLEGDSDSDDMPELISGALAACFHSVWRSLTTFAHSFRRREANTQVEDQQQAYTESEGDTSSKTFPTRRFFVKEQSWSHPLVLLLQTRHRKTFPHISHRPRFPRLLHPPRFRHSRPTRLLPQPFPPPLSSKHPTKPFRCIPRSKPSTSNHLLSTSSLFRCRTHPNKLRSPGRTPHEIVQSERNGVGCYELQSGKFYGFEGYYC